MPYETTTEIETRWRWATASFGLFLIGVIVAADVGSPWLDVVRYLPGADFTGHMVLIGTLAFLAGSWAPTPARLGSGLLSRGAMVVALLVLTEELSQIWLPHRTFSFGDLAADALGIAAAECLRRAFFQRDL